MTPLTVVRGREETNGVVHMIPTTRPTHWPPETGDLWESQHGFWSVSQTWDSHLVLVSTEGSAQEPATDDWLSQHPGAHLAFREDY